LQNLALRHRKATVEFEHDTKICVTPLHVCCSLRFGLGFKSLVPREKSRISVSWDLFLFRGIFDSMPGYSLAVWLNWMKFYCLVSLIITYHSCKFHPIALESRKATMISIENWTFSDTEGFLL
jgi:hypothetical protein